MTKTIATNNTLKSSTLSKIIAKELNKDNADNPLNNELAMWEALLLIKLKEKGYSFFFRYKTNVCNNIEKKEGSEFYQEDIALRIDSKELEEAEINKENIVNSLKTKSVKKNEYQNFMLGFDEAEIVEAYFNYPGNQLFGDDYLKITDEACIFLPENDWFWKKSNDLVKKMWKDIPIEVRLKDQQFSGGLLKTPKITDVIELVVHSMIKTDFQYLDNNSVPYIYDFFKLMHDYTVFYSETVRQDIKLRKIEESEKFLLKFCEDKIKEDKLEIVGEVLNQYVKAYNDCYYFLTYQSKFFENLVNSKNISEEDREKLNNVIANDMDLSDFYTLITKLNEDKMFGAEEISVSIEKVIKFNINKQMDEIFQNKVNSPDLEVSFSNNEEDKLKIFWNEETGNVKVISKIDFKYLTDSEIANKIFKIIVEQEAMPESIDQYFVDLENAKREEHLCQNFENVVKSNQSEGRKRKV